MGYNVICFRTMCSYEDEKFSPRRVHNFKVLVYVGIPLGAFDTFHSENKCEVSSLGFLIIDNIFSLRKSPIFFVVESL